MQGKNIKQIRTRFAPSPTGFLHIGGARTALFNYLFAKKNNGNFVLRIDDTDIARSKSEYEKDILESFKWLGMDYDEGPDVGGPYGPYRQRERLDVYEKYLNKLLEEGKAYYCFCSQEELEAQKQYQQSRGEAPKYSGKCLNLKKTEVEQYLKEGKPCVIRFKVEPKKIKFKDIIRGEVEFDMALAGDIVIAKSLREPLYNFVSVIDDFEMKISHVIRAEEHLSNTPKQILIQEALGFTKPEYAHVPMILSSDRSKMSKRHGATAVSDYKKEGYLPEAIINFIAFIGWNPGDEREIFSLNSLVKEFSIENVQKAGAIFDTNRLDYLNGFYIRQKSVEKLTDDCAPYLMEKGFITSIQNQQELGLNIEKIPTRVMKYKITKTGEIIPVATLEKIIAVEKERIKKLSEIAEFTDFFFTDDLEYESSILIWKNNTNAEIKSSLSVTEKILAEIKDDEWKKEKIEIVLMQEADRTGDRGKVLWPLRAALTGKKASPGPFEVADILGKEKTLARIKWAIEKL